PGPFAIRESLKVPDAKRCLLAHSTSELLVLDTEFFVGRVTLSNQLLHQRAGCRALLPQGTATSLHCWCHIRLSGASDIYRHYWAPVALVDELAESGRALREERPATRT